jgi:hypothetical protein
MKKVKLISILSLLLLSTNTVFAANPLILTIENNTDQDMNPSVSAENLNPIDVAKVADQTIYAHQEYRFIIDRLRYPASLYIIFREASTETGEWYSTETAAEWEYIETENKAESCHIFRATTDYEVRCAGNDNIVLPSTDFQILQPTINDVVGHN